MIIKKLSSDSNSLHILQRIHPLSWSSVVISRQNNISPNIHARGHTYAGYPRLFIRLEATSSLPACTCM